MRYISVDIEGTGINVDNCDILEFGAVADDLDEGMPVEALPQFHCYFKQETYTGEAFGLAMNTEILRRISCEEEGYNYYNPNKFGHKFKMWLIDECGYDLESDRVTINVAGKNFGTYDYPMLKTKTDLFKHVGMRTRFIDPSIMFLQRGDDSIPGLGVCKVRSGSENYVDHTALEDSIDIVNLVRYSIGHMWGIKDD